MSYMYYVMMATNTNGIEILIEVLTFIIIMKDVVNFSF